jgi:glycosyltransferase involved in cell wall biosynthesis
MMIPGLVSIMMPAYNAARYIPDSIRSVLDQTYPHWELVVVNDGSTDETASIAAGFTDPRIRLINQENGGEATARNTALQFITGEFLAFLDADDLFLPEHLLLMVEYLSSHPDVQGVYSDGFHIDSTGRQLAKLSARRRGPFQGSLFEQLVRASDVFGPPICVVVRREAIVKLDLRFDERIVIGPDWDFFIHFAEHFRFGYINDPTCLYRIHDTNISLSARSTIRVESLILCREKAIILPGFSQCSHETRSYLFYDLCINLLAGRVERQAACVDWPQFRDLSRIEQARLLRLMAGRAIAGGDYNRIVRAWLWRSLKYQPFEIRTYVIFGLLGLGLRTASKILSQRYQAEVEKHMKSPFDGITSTIE